jgi:hypothetical protein
MSDSNSALFPSVYFESLNTLETDYRAALLGGIGGMGAPPIDAALGGIGGMGAPPIDATLGGMGGMGAPPIDATLCFSDAPANTTRTAKAKDKK